MLVINIKKIKIIEQSKRLDKGVDYYLHVIDKDDVLYECGVTLNKELILSSVLKKDSDYGSLFVTVSLNKKRTLKASLKELVNTHPEILHRDKQGKKAYYQLRNDDFIARNQKQLSKRKWKVHQVARWPDGYFIARLSCTRVVSDLYHTQFVIFPSDHGQPYTSGSIKINSMGGSRGTTHKVMLKFLDRGLEDNKHWDQLSDALSSIEYGYQTEYEAKHIYDRLVEGQDAAPYHTKSFDVTNAVRQIPLNELIELDIIDEFRSYKGEQSWLFRSDNKYFIMQIDRLAKGTAELLGHGLSTFFTSLEATVKQLLSRCLENAYSLKTDYTEALASWEALIETDLEHRYQSECYSGQVIITHVAFNPEDITQGAVKAKVLVKPNLSLPLSFRPPEDVGIIFDGGSMYSISDLDKTIPLYSYSTSPSALLVDLIEWQNTGLDTGVIKEVERRCKDVFSMHDDGVIDAHWNETTKGYITHVVSDGVSLVPESVRRNTAQHLINQDADLKGSATNESASKHSSQIVNPQQTYPKQLIQIALRKGLLEPNKSHEIKTHESFNGDVLGIDVDTPKLAQVSARPVGVLTKEEHVSSIDDNSLSSTFNRHKYNESGLYNSVIKRRESSRRKWKDDKERKRMWARKKREEVYAQRKEKGIVVAKPGRKKEHVNAAARTRFYRFNKKYTGIAKDSALLIVSLQHALNPRPSLIESIGKLLPFYQNEDGYKRVYATKFINTEQSPQRTLLNDKTCSEGASSFAFPLEWIKGDMSHTYTTPTLSLPNEMIKMMKASGIKQWHICGVGMGTHCYAAAMSMFNEGLMPFFHKSLCQTDNKGQHKMLIELFKKQFGDDCIIS
jgi:isochorismate hydrolase